MPHTTGLLFLASQAIFVLQTWLTADNPRLLTPVEGVTRYEITASMDDQTLDPGLVRHRYGIASTGVVCVTAEAVQEVVTKVEKPIPLERAMFVRLHVQHPDGTKEFWLWPQE